MARGQLLVVVMLACTSIAAQAQSAARYTPKHAAAATRATAVTPTPASPIVNPAAEVGPVVAPASSTTVAAKAAFVTGKRLHKEALATTDVTVRRTTLDQAEAIYTKELAESPNKGAALNNLAVVAVNKGDTIAARQYFERALATDDARKGFYALNYSKFLQTTDEAAATKWAQAAVAAAPDSMSANRQLGALLWRTNPAAMLPLATTLIEGGHTELATQFALQCLTSQSRPAAERRAWLILLAARVANEFGISASVRKSLAADLAKLETDPEIGVGSAQLRAVMLDPPADATDTNWWRSQSEPTGPAKMSGRDVMRAVLLSAGEYFFSRNPKDAERYFASAVEFAAGGPDPDAFLRLVELYASNNETEKLAALMNRYQFELFTEKGQAYARNDWPLIYRMHVALGMTYGHLKVWRSNVEYQNAIFQLSHAMRAADQVNRAAAQSGSTKLIALPPVAIEQLSQGYLSIARPDLAIMARIDGAQTLQTIGHLQDSAQVLRGISSDAVAQLDQKSRAQYERLRAELKL